ncbi:MAG: phosphatase PAP2 family protein [Clostridia bacterium]|nr:phosphatase PAP2 family protein [Clostridia bacterium]
MENERIRKKELLAGIVLLSVFVLWTVLIRHIDVQNAGPIGTEIGFATVNVWFHRLTGVHFMVYTITDWLGLVPVIVCMCFGVLGFAQLVKRRSLWKVDSDILLLGAYYVVVILGYLLFETVPINYRPILLEGNLEASYPSSTVLLVLTVMPTLKHQSDRRIAKPVARKAITVFVIVFSAFMVTGRLIAGVHWITDIIGSVFLSSGLFMIYRSMEEYAGQRKKHVKVEASNGVR